MAHRSTGAPPRSGQLSTEIALGGDLPESVLREDLARLGEPASRDTSILPARSSLQELVRLQWETMPEAQPDAGYLRGRFQSGCKLHRQAPGLLVYSEQAIRDEPPGTGFFDTQSGRNVSREMAIRDFEAGRFAMKVPAAWQGFSSALEFEHAKDASNPLMAALKDAAAPIQRALRRSRALSFAGGVAVTVILTLGQNALSEKFTDLAADPAANARTESTNTGGAVSEGTPEYRMEMARACFSRQQGMRSPELRQFWQQEALNWLTTTSTGLNPGDPAATQAAVDRFLQAQGEGSAQRPVSPRLTTPT